MLQLDERELARRLRFDKPHIYRESGKWFCTSLARDSANSLGRDTPVGAYFAWLEYWDDIYRKLNALAPYQPRPR